MSKVIATTTFSFDCEIMNFEEFLRRVPRSQFDDRVYGYNDMIEMGNPFFQEEGKEDSTYVRRAAVMIHGSEKKVALANLFMQANHGIKWKTPIQELYEDIGVHHLMRFGEPKCLVKLGSRRYAALNPEDFALKSGKQGIALICYATGRLHIWELMPVTEKEAHDKAKEYLAANPPDLTEVEKALKEAQEIIDKVKLHV